MAKSDLRERFVAARFEYDERFNDDEYYNLGQVTEEQMLEHFLYCLEHGVKLREAFPEFYPKLRDDVLY